MDVISVSMGPGRATGVVGIGEAITCGVDGLTIIDNREKAVSADRLVS